MTKINLLNDIKDVPVPVPTQYRERSEQDHKELITVANQSIGAIRELKKHYGHLTIIKDRNGSVGLNETEDDLEFTFEIKK